MESRNIVGTIVLMIVFILVIGLTVTTFTLLKGGFDEQIIREQYNFYLNVFNIFGFGVILIYVAELLIRKGDDSYGDGIGFYSLGEKPHLEFFERYSGVQLTWASFIIFGFLGFLNLLFVGKIPFLQKTYTGLVVLPQQFSPTDSLAFSTLLIPASETIMALFVIALVVFGLRAFSRKFDIDEDNFKVLSIFIVTGVLFLFGIIWHYRIYSGSDLDVLIVGLFWAIGGLITMLSGFIVPFWIIHSVNNFVYDASRLFANDVFLYAYGGVLVLATLGFILWYREDSLRGIYA